MFKIGLNAIKIIFFVFLSCSAVAHTGHVVSGMASGLQHPFSGLDHLLAMLAVGLWAAQSGERRVFLLPVTFMLMLGGGAFLGMSFQSLPIVEVGVAASVLALGLLLTLSLRLSITSSVLVTAVFGLFHGYAHGLEVPQSSAPSLYAFGFLVSTAILHLSGITIGLVSHRYSVQMSRWLGAAIALSGTCLLFLN